MAERNTTSIVDLAWASGFLEGEGSFGCHGGSVRVSAGQVQREPLDRLVKLFGGHIWLRRNSGLGDKPVWIWYLRSNVSAGVMMTLYTFMSPKRKHEIESSLNRWKRARIIRPSGTAVCVKKHEIVGDNAMFIAGRKYPTCRICRNSVRNNLRRLTKLKANLVKNP